MKRNSIVNKLELPSCSLHSGACARVTCMHLSNFSLSFFIFLFSRGRASPTVYHMENTVRCTINMLNAMMQLPVLNGIASVRERQTERGRQGNDFVT